MCASFWFVFFGVLGTTWSARGCVYGVGGVCVRCSVVFVDEHIFMVTHSDFSVKRTKPLWILCFLNQDENRVWF